MRCREFFKALSGIAKVFKSQIRFEISDSTKRVRRSFKVEQFRFVKSSNKKFSFLSLNSSENQFQLALIKKNRKFSFKTYEKKNRISLKLRNEEIFSINTSGLEKFPFRQFRNFVYFFFYAILQLNKSNLQVLIINFNLPKSNLKSLQLSHSRNFNRLSTSVEI